MSQRRRNLLRYQEACLSRTRELYAEMLAEYMGAVCEKYRVLTENEAEQSHHRQELRLARQFREAVRDTTDSDKIERDLRRVLVRLEQEEKTVRKVLSTIEQSWGAVFDRCSADLARAERQLAGVEE